MNNATNTKWTMAVVAAFIVGVGATALMTGQKQSEPDVADMAAIATQMNDIQPVAGDKPETSDKKAEKSTGTVVAKVDDQPITLDEVKMFAQSMPPQIAQAPIEKVFPIVREQMVVGTMISKKAAEEGLADDAEVQKRIAMMKDNVIRATYLERIVNKRITESAQKAEYQKFVKDFKPAEEVSAQHILVDDEAKAKEIITKINDGAKFEDMVKEFSKDKGPGEKGDLGYFKASDMVKEFSEAAFGMKKGTLSKEPVKTQFGWHVIKVNDRRMSKAPSFDELQSQIKEKLQRQAFEETINDLRKNAKIELFTIKGEPEPKVEPAAAKTE